MSNREKQREHKAARSARVTKVFQLLKSAAEESQLAISKLVSHCAESEPAQQELLSAQTSEAGSQPTVPDGSSGEQKVHQC